MDRQYAPQDHAPAVVDGAGHASLRQDFASEQTVEIGIKLQELLGTRDAASFLKNNVVAIEVALRVLLHPQRRRRT